MKKRIFFSTVLFSMILSLFVATNISTKAILYAPTKHFKDYDKAIDYLEDFFKKTEQKEIYALDAKDLTQIIDLMLKLNIKYGSLGNKDFRTRVDKLSIEGPRDFVDYIRDQAHLLAENKYHKAPLGSLEKKYFKKVKELLNDKKILPDADKIIDNLTKGMVRNPDVKHYDPPKPKTMTQKFHNAIVWVEKIFKNTWKKLLKVFK